MSQATQPLTPEQQYALIGKVVILMAGSAMHRHFSISEMKSIILPAIHLNQYRLYANDQGEALGFVAWAFFSESVERKFLSGHSVLSHEEWQSGEKIYFTDFIARENSVVQQMVKDLKTNVFADSVVHALRFDKPGDHRNHISKYYGANVRPPK